MTSSFVRAASIAELHASGGVLGVIVNGVPVALYATQEGYFATLDRCTHGAVKLSEGYLEDGLIECPLHQGLFDVRTGEVKGPPCTLAVPTFEVRQEGGDLFIAVTVAAEIGSD